MSRCSEHVINHREISREVVIDIRGTCTINYLRNAMCESEVLHGHI